MNRPLSIGAAAAAGDWSWSRVNAVRLKIELPDKRARNLWNLKTIGHAWCDLFLHIM